MLALISVSSCAVAGQNNRVGLHGSRSHIQSQNFICGPIGVLQMNEFGNTGLVDLIKPLPKITNGNEDDVLRVSQTAINASHLNKLKGYALLWKDAVGPFRDQFLYLSRSFFNEPMWVTKDIFSMKRNSQLNTVGRRAANVSCLYRCSKLDCSFRDPKIGDAYLVNLHPWPKIGLHCSQRIRVAFGGGLNSIPVQFERTPNKSDSEERKKYGYKPRYSYGKSPFRHLPLSVKVGLGFLFVFCSIFNIVYTMLFDRSGNSDATLANVFLSFGLYLLGVVLIVAPIR